MLNNEFLALTISGGVSLTHTNTGFSDLCFRAEKSGSQFISTSDPTKLTFETESFDYTSQYASNRFTCTKEGIYFLYSNIFYFSVTSSTQVRVLFKKNNTQYIAGTASDQPTTAPHASVYAIEYLEVGDYIEVFSSSADSSYTVLLGSTSFFFGFLLQEV